KFAAIVASNLDEFFMVRVAGLRHAVVDGDATPDATGLTPRQQLDVVCTRAHTLVKALYDVTHEVLSALEPSGLRIVPWSALDKAQKVSLGEFFRANVLPVLTPLAIDVSRPFPLLSSLSLNLALRLDPADNVRFAIVQVPARLTRLVKIGEPG